MTAARVDTSPAEGAYFERVSAAYERVGAMGVGDEVSSLVNFMRELFDYQIDYRLGNNFDNERRERLLNIRASAEESRVSLESAFAGQEMHVIEFVLRSDLDTISFQKRAAEVLNANEYEALFDVKRGEFITLADPAIVPNAYPQRPL
jgi:hypothetical protein